MPITLSPNTKQFIVFLLVGSINTLFSYTLFSLLIFCGFHYTLASLCATAIGVFFSFKTMGSIVFRNPDNTLLLRFIGVYTCLYFVNIFIIKVCSYFTANLYASGAIAIIICAGIAFLFNKFLVFRKNTYEAN